MTIFYIVHFRQSMNDIWVTKLTDGGEKRKYYDLDDAKTEAQKIGKIYGYWNVKIVDNFGMLVRE